MIGINSVDDLQYQCCLCGEEIDKSADGQGPVDPCAIVLIANWSKPEAEQTSQQFFCHLACFRKTVWHNVPVGVELLAPSGDRGPDVG
jgi:hypothetical protein